MLKWCWVIIMLLACRICTAQNFIPNESFELFTACPNTWGQINLAAPWMNPADTSGGSPDYFNACATGTSVSVPDNFAGYQQAFTGTAYSGIYLFTNPLTSPDFREYLEVPLVLPILPGNSYYFEMNVSLANGSRYTTDDFGIYFSDTIISGIATSNFLPLTPQISNPSGLLIDTLNWVVMSGHYVATDTANYLLIGNFKDDFNSTMATINTTGNIDGCYIYIDDISLKLLTGINESQAHPEINIYPNPHTDKLNIRINNNELSEVILYDVASQKLLQQLFTNTTTLNTQLLAKGIYICQVKNKNGVIKKIKVVKD